MMMRLFFVFLSRRRLALASGLAVGLALAALLAWPATPGRAQLVQPTPTPAAISAVARGGGAAIWDSAGQPVATAAPGERLTATARSADGQWLFVQRAPGVRGWVALSDVLIFNREALPVEAVTIAPALPTPAPPAEANDADEGDETAAAPAAPAAQAQPDASIRVTVVDVNLNVRAGPGTGYAVIGRATSGQSLAAQGRSADGAWVQVTLPDAEDSAGWVAARYLEASQPIDDLPVMEPAAGAGSATAQASAPSAEAARPQPASQATVPTGLRGKLVFQTAWGGDIYVYHLATGALQRLTSGFDPAISPDGTQVAFTRLGGQHGLYLIDIDGNNERRLFSERNEFFSPKWSPDGGSILFMRTDSTYDCEFCIPEELRTKFPWYRVRPRLARVDVNGENYLDLASLDTATAPDWNSAGVVYSSAAGIQITTASGRDENRQVVFNIRQQYYQDPDWQPNGGRIVYQQRRAGRWALFAVNPDGGGQVELNPPPTVLVDAMPSNVAAAWSPDGRHIAFLSNRAADNGAGEWGIWVMEADGGNARRLPIELPFEYHFVEEQMVDWGP